MLGIFSVIIFLVLLGLIWWCRYMNFLLVFCVRWVLSLFSGMLSVVVSFGICLGLCSSFCGLI